MVFVLDSNKTPLDMCHSARARKLLKQGKAKIYRKIPFTIILNKMVDSKPENSYRLKIDYGSRHTGLAILKNRQVMWLGQLEHKTTIKDDMQKRAGYRRRRRSANLRYRKPRFDNRTRPEGWLVPSLQSRVQNIETWLNRLSKLVPLGYISYENVKFDTQLMEDPDIKGIEYQQGTLYGYEIREYLMEKFHRKCAYCGKTDVPLEIEHIIPKSRGGSNKVSNLTISCHDCNTSKNTMTAAEFGHPEVEVQAKKPLQDAAVVNATRWKIYKALKGSGLDIECGSGGLTKFNRTNLVLPKQHYYDACCVGRSTPDALYFKTDNVQIISAKGRGKHQRTNVDTSGFPRGYLSRQKQFFGFKTGDTVKAVVPLGKNVGTHYGTVACRKSGSFDIKTKAGRVQGVNHKYFRLIQSTDGYAYYTERRVATSSPCLKVGASVA